MKFCLIAPGPEFRPVPLTTHVVGYPPAKSDFFFDRDLLERVPDILARFSENKPSLIFCSSRKGTEVAALKLANLRRFAP